MRETHNKSFPLFFLLLAIDELNIDFFVCGGFSCASRSTFFPPPFFCTLREIFNSKKRFVASKKKDWICKKRFDFPFFYVLLLSCTE